MMDAETPDEKRVRLAKAYLADLGGEEKEVSEKLQFDVDAKSKKHRHLVEDLTMGEPQYLKGHKMCPTCVCLSSDERTLYSGGKDCAIVRWDIETGKKDIFPGWRNCFDVGGHFEAVLDLCLMERIGLLASVGADRTLRCWDHRAPTGSQCVTKLLGHNGTITSVVAEPDSTRVYTASLDKSMKLWDLSTRRPVDTFFGHVNGVTCLDIYQKDRLVSGGEDKTVRLWKMERDTHLMFNRHTASVDAVAVSDHERVVSGGQDGKLMVWSSTSKKPVASASVGAGQWCTALASVRAGNVVFSGTTNGELQAWRLAKAEEGKGLKMLPAAPVINAPGCVNAIAAGKKVLVCAVGKEHKFGRWHYDKKQKMGLMVVPLSYREE